MNQFGGILGQCESILYVLDAFPTFFARLCFGVFDAYDHPAQQGQSGDVDDAFRQLFALVIAPFSLAFLCQRHGQEEIDSFEETCWMEFLSHESAQGDAHLGMMAIFQSIQRAAYIRLTGVECERRAPLHRCASPQEACHLVVVGREMVIRSGDFQVAATAEKVFARSQSVVTAGAGAGRKQVGQSPPNANHRATGRHRSCIF